MSEAQVSFAAITSIRRRVRINIDKTATKGYTAETSVELEWEWSDLAYERELADLLHVADNLARFEINRREAADAEEGGGGL